MILSVTGHRPDKLGGYTPKAFDELVRVAKVSLDLLLPEHVITGMAMGWDMAIAKACVDKGIAFTAAVPFKGQESRWQPQDQQRYKYYLSRASTIEIISPGNYAPFKMDVRNRWMVDQSDTVLSLYNGDREGGTANCVAYAKKKKKTLYNAWRIYKKEAIVLTKVEYD